MKRFFAPVSAAFLIVGILATTAFAAPAPVVKFQGSAGATALDLNIPALGGLSPDLARIFPGVTIGRTSSSYGSGVAAGGAAGQCNLLAAGTGDAGDPLSLCNRSTVASSDALSGNPGSDTAQCGGLFAFPATGASVVNIGTACGRSSSAITAGAPSSINEASVAYTKVGLDLSGLSPETEIAKDALVTSVQDVLNSVFSTVPSLGIDNQQNALRSALTDFLNSVSLGTHAVSIKVGPSSTIVETVGDITTVTSKAAAASVGLLGLTDALSDGLMIIEVSGSQASASWDNIKGIASAPAATQALATIKVRDLLDLVPGDYLTTIVTVDQLNSLLEPLNTIPLLATTISVGKATEAQEGRSVSASASGIEIYALKGLGSTASANEAPNGGVDLRLATAQVALAGDKVLGREEDLPRTGGPTFLYVAAGMALILGAAAAFRGARKMRATA